MLHPTRGKLLVEVIEDEKLTQSGLILSFKEEIPHRGRIISLGLPFRDKKCKEHPWGMVEGHIVHFKRVWDQRKVKHYILKREQIYAVECNQKVYGFSDYIIVRKEPEITGLLHIPSHFVTDEKLVEQAVVVSVGKEDRLGLKEHDIIAYYKNEGLSVKIPNQEEVWSLNPRAIVGILK